MSKGLCCLALFHLINLYEAQGIHWFSPTGSLLSIHVDHLHIVQSIVCCTPCHVAFVRLEAVDPIKNASIQTFACFCTFTLAKSRDPVNAQSWSKGGSERAMDEETRNDERRSVYRPAATRAAKVVSHPSSFKRNGRVNST